MTETRREDLTAAQETRGVSKSRTAARDAARHFLDVNCKKRATIYLFWNQFECSGINLDCDNMMKMKLHHFIFKYTATEKDASSCSSTQSNSDCVFVSPWKSAEPATLRSLSSASVCGRDVCRARGSSPAVGLFSN